MEKPKKFKVGDKVRLRKDCDLVIEYEEIHPTEIHEVSDIRWSQICGDYVQLKGICSSYRFAWIELAE